MSEVARVSPPGRWGQVMRWALYPVLYFMYAMVGGALSGDYPYPFIDADALGHRRALVNAGGLLLGFITLSLLLVAVGRPKRAGGVAAAPPSEGRAR